MSTTTKKLPTPKGSDFLRWLVLVDGREVGLVEKAKAERLTVHPFKAYRGIGEACTYAGYAYDAAEIAKKSSLKIAPCEAGGFEAAVRIAAGR